MRRALPALLSLIFLAACSDGSVGSSCNGGAEENDCVEGAICTLERSEETEPPLVPNNESFFCRAICDTESDCEDGFVCRRAEGTMRSSCQPETASDVDAGM